MVAEALDARHGVTSHSSAIREALQAMQEAKDFAQDPSGGSDRVRQIVGTHQTPVLKEASTAGMPALVAMQHYYAFAEQRLVAAAGGAPIASSAFYAMGKLHMAMAETEPQMDNQQRAAQAMAFLQASLAVDARQYAAAHELGVMLARLGQLHEAREALRHSARIQPTPETWKNLEIVHRQLGEDLLAARARAAWERDSTQTSGLPAAGAESVQWVPPAAFAGPPGATRPAPHAAPRPPASGAPSSTSRTANRPTGFSIWPWRS